MPRYSTKARLTLFSHTARANWDRCGKHVVNPPPPPPPVPHTPHCASASSGTSRCNSSNRAAHPSSLPMARKKVKLGSRKLLLQRPRGPSTTCFLVMNVIYSFCLPFPPLQPRKKFLRGCILDGIMPREESWRQECLSSLTQERASRACSAASSLRSSRSSSVSCVISKGGMEFRA